MSATSIIFVSPASAAPTSSIRADADWILRAQSPDGSIAHYVDRTAIWPYLGNFAALGLARAFAVTKDPRYSSAAWRWLAWYQSHQDSSGFVTDYRKVDGVFRSTGTMDSTDSYAGTFLLATSITWRATGGGTRRLAGLAVGISRAVAAILATQDRDGLTWAKPSYHVKYLMDQAETYAGLRAAADVATALHATGLARRASAAAGRMRAGIDRLWNPRLGAYDWAVHADGARQPTRWALLYPDSLQQAWAVAFDAVAPARAADLMRRFQRAQPAWSAPGSLARFDDGTRRVGYWAPAGWAMARVGDLARSAGAARSIAAAAITAGRAWPFTPSDAGQLIVLSTGGLAGPPRAAARPRAIANRSSGSASTAPARLSTRRPEPIGAPAVTGHMPLPDAELPALSAMLWAQVFAAVAIAGGVTLVGAARRRRVRTATNSPAPPG